MNWQSTLRKITDETALHASSHWVQHPLNLTLINNQINCVYRFQDGHDGYYLRMTHESIRPRADLEAALDFQAHLFLQGAPVCESVPNKKGALIEEIQQDDLTFLAQVCREVPGQIITFDHTDPRVYFRWGAALAKLHQASQSYQPGQHRFKNWQDLWQETCEYAQNEDPEIQAAVHQVDAWLKAENLNSKHFGLTHADHRPGNVLFDGSAIHFIDFDEPVYHGFMSDIARPFLDLPHPSDAQKTALLEAYLKGYRSVLALSDEAIQSIPIFAQMKSLDLYLWSKNNWHEPTAPGGKSQAQWLRELRAKLLIPIPCLI